jgi:hypothetical protein
MEVSVNVFLLHYENRPFLEGKEPLPPSLVPAYWYLWLFVVAAAIATAAFLAALVWKDFTG